MRPIWVSTALLALSAVARADSSGLASGRVTLELYDVSRWVYSLVEFPSGGALAIERPKPAGLADPQEFARMIKAVAAPRPLKGWTFECQNGVLVVRAPSTVHRAVATYLQDLETRRR